MILCATSAFSAARRYSFIVPSTQPAREARFFNLDFVDRCERK